MQRTQDDLYKRSLNNQNFIKLMDIIQCDENIMLAYRNIKRNGGSQTPGTDGKTIENLGQHRTIAEASAVESPIRQETIGFPAHFFARAHNFKPPGRACQPEADSPMRT